MGGEGPTERRGTQEPARPEPPTPAGEPSLGAAAIGGSGESCRLLPTAIPIVHSAVSEESVTVTVSSPSSKPTATRLRNDDVTTASKARHGVGGSLQTISDRLDAAAFLSAPMLTRSSWRQWSSGG